MGRGGWGGNFVGGQVGGSFGGMRNGGKERHIMGGWKVTKCGKSKETYL